MEDLSYSIIEGQEHKQAKLFSLEEHGHEYVRRVMKLTAFNITRASEILKISRPKLYRILKQLELEETINSND